MSLEDGILGNDPIGTRYEDGSVKTGQYVTPPPDPSWPLPNWSTAADSWSPRSKTSTAERSAIAERERSAGKDPAGVWAAAGKGINATLLQAGRIIPGMVIRGGVVVSYSAFTGYARVRLDDGVLADIKVTDGSMLAGSRVSVEYPPSSGARIAGVAESAWAALPLSAGWTAGVTSPRYKRDSGGNVLLQGQVVGAAAAAATIANLPARFRPSRTIQSPIWATAPLPGFAYTVAVLASGAVAIPAAVGGSGITVSLDGIIYPAEA